MSVEIEYLLVRILRELRQIKFKLYNDESTFRSNDELKDEAHRTIVEDLQTLKVIFEAKE